MAIRSLIQHRGDQNRGHYTCFVNVDDVKVLEGWYYMSDDNVEKVWYKPGLVAVLRNNTEAYIVIYESS